MELWDNKTIEQGHCLIIRIGLLTVWITNEGKEWHIAHEYGDGHISVPKIHMESSKPDGKEWTRWIIKEQTTQCQLEPALPDRPVVLRAEHGLQIPKGVATDFYIGLPLWLRVYIGDRKKHKIMEKPSITLSNTWFGEIQSGELSYAIKSALRQYNDDLDPFSHKAICPVMIKNSSAENLEFHRLCVRVNQLSIYEGTDQIWTNEIRVNFKGAERFSHIEISEKRPSIDTINKLLSGPREAPSGGFVKKTFSSIKHFSVWRA